MSIFGFLWGFGFVLFCGDGWDGMIRCGLLVEVRLR